MPVRTRKMIGMTLETGSARQLVLDTYEGDVTISGLEAGGVAAVPILDRGTYAESVEGDDSFPTLAVTLKHDGRLTDAVSQKIADMLMKQGAASADATTDPGQRVWMLKIVVNVTYPGGGVDLITACNARPKWDYTAAAEGNNLSLSFDCYRDGAGADPIVIT